MPTITVEVEKCSIDGCTKPASAKSYCVSHYRRFKLFDDPLHTKRQFHGIPTKVVAISIPVALIEAAQAECEEDEKAVTKLARILVDSEWGEKALKKAGVDLSQVGALVVTRNKNGAVAETKPKKKGKKKKSENEQTA